VGRTVASGGYAPPIAPERTSTIAPPFADAAFGRPVRRVRHRTGWHGKHVVAVGRFFPEGLTDDRYVPSATGGRITIERAIGPYPTGGEDARRGTRRAPQGWPGACPPLRHRLARVAVEHVRSTVVPGCADKGFVDLLIPYRDGGKPAAIGRLPAWASSDNARPPRSRGTARYASARPTTTARPCCCPVTLYPPTPPRWRGGARARAIFDARSVADRDYSRAEGASIRAIVVPPRLP
jgi:hypothetical protein